MILRKRQYLRAPFDSSYGMLEQILFKSKPQLLDNAFIAPLDWSSFMKMIG